MLIVIKSSESPLIQVLFEDVDLEAVLNPSAVGPNRKRPTTSGFKIKQQVGALVKTLSECDPHYVRCIKPNDVKRAKVFTEDRVKHQITYLGMLLTTHQKAYVLLCILCCLTSAMPTKTCPENMTRCLMF